MQRRKFLRDSLFGAPLLKRKRTSERSIAKPVDSLPNTLTTTPVTDSTLWGNVYGAAHGGVCAGS